MITNSTSCAAAAETGERCKANPRSGSAYCFHHDPASEPERLAARRAGGVARSKPSAPPATLAGDIPAPSLRSIEDVVLLLGSTIHQVRTGQIDPKVANSVGYLGGILLKALDLGELERRVAALEEAAQARSVADAAGFDPHDPALPTELNDE